MEFEQRGSGIFAPKRGLTVDDYMDEARARVVRSHELYRGAEGLRADTASVQALLFHHDADNVWANVATEQDLLLPQELILLPGNSFWYVGKQVRITALGSIVTGAAPGNLTLAIRYGGSSTTGVILATTGAIAMTASIAGPFIWRLEVLISCRAIGTAGSLFAIGAANGMTSVTPPISQQMGSAGPTVPVAVAVDTTVSTNALRITGLQSAAVAATQIVMKVAIGEALN
jgi:hypothetical protein